MRAFLASLARSLFPIVAALSLTVASLFAADGRFDRTFAVSTPLKVDVLADTGCISVRSGQPGRIEIHARLQSVDDSGDEDIEARIRAIELNPPVVSDPHGHSVRIGHFANPDASRNISICYEIVVPSDTQLHSETGAGDQTIEGIQGPVDATSGSGKLHVWHIGKDTHVSTGSGDIDLRDVRGHIQAKAGTGTIHATEIRGELPNSGRPQLVSATAGWSVSSNTTPEGSADLEIITGSGDVEIENLEGGLQVTSGSGNIKASGKPASDWQLDTGAGTVRVIFPVDSNLALIAHTSSGTIIKNDDAIAVRGTRNPHELRGQVGKGGPTVNLKTASGDIEIE